MKYFQFFIFTYFSILIPLSSFASDHQEVSLVSWALSRDESGYLPRDQFYALTKKIYSTDNFSKRLVNVTEIDFDYSSNLLFGKKQFQESIAEAVKAISNSNRPVLAVAINGHGIIGRLIRDDHGFESYRDIIDIILKELEKQTQAFRNSVELELIVSACYSGSLLPILKKSIAKTNTSLSENDSVKYRYKVTAITSAAWWTSSASSPNIFEYIDHISKINEKHTGVYRFDAKDWSTLVNFDGPNQHQVWSSFRTFDTSLLSIQPYMWRYIKEFPGLKLSEDLLENLKPSFKMPSLLKRFLSESIYRKNQADIKFVVESNMHFNYLVDDEELDLIRPLLLKSDRDVAFLIGTSIGLRGFSEFNFPYSSTSGLLEETKIIMAGSSDRTEQDKRNIHFLLEKLCLGDDFANRYLGAHFARESLLYQGLTNTVNLVQALLLELDSSENCNPHYESHVKLLIMDLIVFGRSLPKDIIPKIKTKLSEFQNDPEVRLRNRRYSSYPTLEDAFKALVL